MNTEQTTSKQTSKAKTTKAPAKKTTKKANGTKAGPVKQVVKAGKKQTARKAKASSKKAATETKTKGVITTIAALVERAGKKGISKQEILDVLVTEFPDRDPASMTNTINVQVPTRLNKERFPVEKVGNDRYRKGTAE